jgi:hypothetical protein
MESADWAGYPALTSVHKMIKSLATNDHILKGFFMSTANLEFQIKRGVINSDDLDEDGQNIIIKCIELCNKKQNKKAIDLIFPLMSFEWTWNNCDGDTSEILEDSDDIFVECTKENTVIQLGADDGNLIITATVKFVVQVKDELTEEDLSSWLEDNSAYSCGYLSGGWSYSGSDGDNVWVIDLKDA